MQIRIEADCQCGWGGFLSDARSEKEKGRATEISYHCPLCKKVGVTVRYPEKSDEDNYVV